jgi:hypothetical protein
MEINILNIDIQIQEKFNNDKNNIEIYKKRLKNIYEYIENTKDKPRIQKTLQKISEELRDEIDDLDNNKYLNFYLTETSELLSEYKEILKIPITLSFMGKANKDDKEKKRIITEYIKIACKYIDLDININNMTMKKEKILCDNCTNSKEFDIIDNNIYICKTCNSQQIIFKQISSYKDIDRVNIIAKYTYARNIHFRDCINQYQGKQNCTIDDKVYKQLEDEFDKHYLLVNSQIKEIKFKNITKEHIMMFLKTLKYTKHYENVNLIHYNLTGIKPDDIGYLEDQLMFDFDILTELYDKKYKHLTRKNFINTQYVLYQLLMRHKHPCKKENFTILKTFEREIFHDEIVKDLFEELDWNFTPTT